MALAFHYLLQLHRHCHCHCHDYCSCFVSLLCVFRRCYLDDVVSAHCVVVGVVVADDVVDDDCTAGGGGVGGGCAVVVAVVALDADWFDVNDDRHSALACWDAADRSVGQQHLDGRPPIDFRHRQNARSSSVVDYNVPCHRIDDGMHLACCVCWDDVAADDDDGNDVFDVVAAPALAPPIDVDAVAIRPHSFRSNCIGRPRPNV